MVYTEKEIDKIKELKFNDGIELPNVDVVTLSELNEDKVYLIKVKVDDCDRNLVATTCINIKEAFERIGIAKVLILPVCGGMPTIDVYELEPSNVETSQVEKED